MDSALLDLYFHDIADSRPLPAHAETALARRIRVGDDAARNTLVQANLRFVVRVASEFQGCGMDLEDLISAGLRHRLVVDPLEHFDDDKFGPEVAVGVDRAKLDVVAAKRQRVNGKAIPMAQESVKVG